MKRVISVLAAGLLLAGLVLGGLGWAMGGKRVVEIQLFGQTMMVGSPVGQRGEKRTDGAELGAITAMSVEVSSADIVIKRGDRYAVELTWYGEEYELRYEAVDGVLRVWENGEQNLWILFGGMKEGGLVTIVLPEDSRLGEAALDTAYGDIKAEQLRCEALRIANNLGDVELDSIAADFMDIHLFNGRLTAARLTANRGELHNSLGAVELKDSAFGTLTAELDNGRLLLERCVVETADLKNNLGRITATNLISGGMRVESSNGAIALEGQLSGETVVDQSLGKVTVENTLSMADCSYDLESSLGSIHINGEKAEGRVKSGTGANHLVVKSSNGGINVTFGK